MLIELAILHDEGLRYAERLRAAGVDVSVQTSPGMIHGFTQMGRAIQAAETTASCACRCCGNGCCRCNSAHCLPYRTHARTCRACVWPGPGAPRGQSAAQPRQPSRRSLHAVASALTRQKLKRKVVISTWFSRSTARVLTN
ncbi:alpha/beta hydrolase [Xanthomonas cassavae CFBP 4642]|uniref:Alpha/beta hydrolase n=1 Tax=Xanthomonas cassavae CFBP 4642 TaxID=1219375 RepID=A0ABS8HCP4_9XANT|nr:alpha/beta hydrolase fold domain-containing protein [Xanthomonas cassavae]MCC4619919.1 alpha/beta hydrolase [Xanthomonas cassavae CFBP 4642]